MLRGLRDAAAERFSFAERPGDIVNADEEQHLITGSLQRADRCRRSTFGARDYERVSGIRAVRITPTEQLPRNSRVPSGSLERISVWTTGCGIHNSLCVVSPGIAGLTTKTNGAARKTTAPQYSRRILGFGTLEAPEEGL